MAIDRETLLAYLVRRLVSVWSGVARSVPDGNAGGVDRAASPALVGILLTAG
jgi:hypothetical protein